MTATTPKAVTHPDSLECLMDLAFDCARIRLVIVICPYGVHTSRSVFLFTLFKRKLFPREFFHFFLF